MEQMKNSMRLGVFVLLVGLVLGGCTSAFHNGTQMTVAKVMVTGLPAGVYPAGQQLVFSFNDGNGNWIHDIDTVGTKIVAPDYTAAVAADGSWTLTLSTPLVVATGQIQFLLIDPTKNWNALKVDKKVSGKSGGDVYLDNTWGKNVSIVGKVSGDDVTWDIE
jgi:hypothetical protein